jgi:phage shock protein PspC (stress-responsive transcriptional regulator)
VAMGTPSDPRSRAIAFGGATLILGGVWLLVRDFIPWNMTEIIGRWAGPIMLIGLGVIVIMLSRRGGFTVPRSGTRLYRSRTDRLLGGVLGGMGVFLGIDPLVLRLAVVLLTFMGAGLLVPAYIVMWVLVPEEPVDGAPSITIPPAPPVPSAPPAPPAPGA